MIFIKRFGELGSSDIEQAGGKGANLGELTRAGLPVPPGFVVLTEAYRAYIAEHQLNDRITALAAASDDPTAQSVNFSASTFGRITSQAGIPRILQFGVKYDF